MYSFLFSFGQTNIFLLAYNYIRLPFKVFLCLSPTNFVNLEKDKGKNYFTYSRYPKKMDIFTEKRKPIENKIRIDSWVLNKEPYLGDDRNLVIPRGTRPFAAIWVALLSKGRSTARFSFQCQQETEGGPFLRADGSHDTEQSVRGVCVSLHLPSWSGLSG